MKDEGVSYVASKSIVVVFSYLQKLLLVSSMKPTVSGKTQDLLKFVHKSRMA